MRLPKTLEIPGIVRPGVRVAGSIPRGLLNVWRDSPLVGIQHCL